MFYRYKDFVAGIEQISEEISISGKFYHYIIGICRGGLIPATTLSYRLNIPLIPITINTHGLEKPLIDMEAIKFIHPTQNIVVVEDIVDTGHTIKILQENWKHPSMDIACLVYNEAQPLEVQYKHKIINKVKDPSWVTFWWD